MKILLLNLYYPPDTSATARMAAIVGEALAERHDVTVVCGRPSYDPVSRRPWRFWQNESVGKLRVVRVGSTDYSRFAMKRRVINYLSYVALAVPLTLLLECDVVVAMTDPPFEGIVGGFVAMLKRRPYVYNIRDLYPDMAIAGSIMPAGFWTRLWERMHRWALRRASRVVVLGEDMRARVIAKGVSAERVKVVRDGAEIAEAEAAPPAIDEQVVQGIRRSDRVVLLHAGNLGFYGAWESLVRAMAQLDGDGTALVFVGEGAQRQQIEQWAAGVKNVRFLSFFPASKIPSVLAAADAHVVTVKRGLEGVVVPSKMYGILAAGKPIVAVAPPESDAAALGTRFGFAVAADPDHPNEIAAAIRSIAADPSKVQQMSQRAREVAPDYDRVKELRKFVRILEEVVNA